MLAGVSWILLWLLPETYAPIILSRMNRLRKTRNEKQNAAVAVDPQSKDPKLNIKAVPVRPIRLFFSEPIVFCVCMYLALVFGIFYLFFDAYLIIF
jgi:hypothetical protein